MGGSKGGEEGIEVGSGRKRSVFGEPIGSDERAVMVNESRVEGCLVRELVEWNALVRALSEILAVDPTDIRAFDLAPSNEPRPPILVESHEHEVGFRMD